MKVKLLEEGSMPWKRYDQDAGWDLRARESNVIRAQEVIAIKTGVCVEIPPGFCGEIRPRSSMSKRGLVIPLGTIDSNYRGEIEIIVVNPLDNYSHIAKGERIAQLVITPCMLGDLEIVDELSQSDRGTQGFGHTGKM